MTYKKEFDEEGFDEKGWILMEFDAKAWVLMKIMGFDGFLSFWEFRVCCRSEYICVVGTL